MRIDATFVTSAASAADLPRDGLPEVALVGRSNVGKSSLINALARQQVARTSGAPGKTRLANIYRVARGAAALYLVDLPGYGYARGDAGELEAVTRAYFRRDRREGQERRAPPAQVSALLVIDSRHPGLERDIDAWRWLRSAVERFGIAATKIDKLARGERIRALRELESVFENSVLPVSAVTGEGLDELWILIEHLANSNNNEAPAPRPPRTKAPPLPTRAPGRPKKAPRAPIK